MVEPLDVVIETERLRLVPASEDVAADIFREFTPEVTAFMYPRPPEAIEETLAFLQEATARMTAADELTVAIQKKTTGEFLGCGGLHNIRGETPELGIWIKLGAHGHRYGREAVTGLASWGFANLSVRYLVYPVDRRNTASRTIPEALGGIIEDEYTRTNASGRLLDLVEYRIYPPAG